MAAIGHITPIDIYYNKSDAVSNAQNHIYFILLDATLDALLLLIEIDLYVV